jgi:hypothetical protein
MQRKVAMQKETTKSAMKRNIMKRNNNMWKGATTNLKKGNNTQRGVVANMKRSNNNHKEDQ